ncbi:MAG: hypothetical protein EAZ57_09505 [Cytophagales bacterium]|nr:MAG: hypothetical protein EAZ67_01465 [Cytophagales bacterium]TAF59874.1 MAG: hypothetical protein EAZ57_09505 [Cytophagales bacterium]
MKKAILFCTLFSLVSLAYAQQGRTIQDFYNQFTKKVPAVLSAHGVTAGQTTWKQELIDLKNGYVKFSVVDKSTMQPDMECASYEMAVWKTAAGSLIIGVFPTYCGGEGCGGQLNNLRFFNTSWKDITDEVIDKDAIISKARRSQFSNNYTPSGDFFSAEMECSVVIPRQGTTLSVTPRLAGMAEGTAISIKFDKASGRFVL